MTLWKLIFNTNTNYAPICIFVEYNITKKIYITKINKTNKNAGLQQFTINDFIKGHLKLNEQR